MFLAKVKNTHPSYISYENLIFSQIVNRFNIIIFIIIVVIVVVIIIIIIIIIITSETGITIYNYKSHRKLVNVKGLKKKLISVYKFKA